MVTRNSAAFDAFGCKVPADNPATPDRLKPDISFDRQGANEIDMVMPDADGFEVIKALGTAGCTAPVLLISGFNPHYLQSAQAIAAHYGIERLTAMRKPLHIAEVRQFMRMTLAPA